MHLQFLGTGSAFTMNNWQTNFLIRVNGRRLLVDCGGDIRHSLEEAGFNHRAIDEVYISHQHADHIGGLEWLAFMSYFDPGCEGRPTLHVADDPQLDLWGDYLKFSLQYLVGCIADAGEFFRWNELNIPLPNDEGLEPETFKFGHLTLQPVSALHVPGECSEQNMMAYGLRIWGPEEPKVYWSADTTFDPEALMPHYEWADYIIHDCETTYKDADLANMGVRKPAKSGVHPHFSELEKLPEEIKAKMLLVHYQDNVLDEHGRVDKDWKVQAYAAGFAGFVEPKSEIVFWPPEEDQEG